MPRTPPPRPRVPLAVLLLLCRIPLQCAASTVSGSYNCAKHDPTQSAASPGCLSRLSDPAHAWEYERCREPNSTTTCYIFLQEPPFVSLDTAVLSAAPEALQYQRPFRCGDHANVSPPLGGIAFELHARTSSRDDLCMWGGHPTRCTFNALVDYTQTMAAKGYRFAVTGLLLETPQRQCHHEASTPFVDNSMIIIGRKTPQHSTTNTLYQLTRPFHWGAWAIFGGVVLLFMIVCIAIAVRFHVLRGRSFITAFFIFTGEREEALAHEMHLNGHRHTSAAQAMSFATKYGLSMTLYRIALVAFLGIFALFYEVAVVNFLFQQQSLSLTKSVTSLSTAELGQYSVLKNSALENVWNATANANGDKYNAAKRESPPWRQCDTATECIQWVDDPSKPAKFVVTFEVVGKYLLKTESDCDKLTIFETKDILYQFNAGWLYNDRVDEERRKQVDRELVALRINGTTRRLIDAEIGDFSCTNAIKADIGPYIILVPCMCFVIPPLLCSILVLLLWKRRRPRVEKNRPTMNEMVSGIAAGGSTSSA